MAISASFHRNVVLLNQLIPPDHDFKKTFREGMFDKPNTVGFINVSHYLLTIYDAKRFKKLVEWPVICKKTETKYRNNVKDYLNAIALENPDMGFPHVVTTYLHHASGTKFMTIMWKLSQLALKAYIMRDGKYTVLSVPKPGPMSDLAKTYLQQKIATVTSDTLSCHRNCVQMEKAVNLALAEGKEHLAEVKKELFDKKQSLAKCASMAPVADSIKQCLTNVEDTEIISMWKNSLDKNIQYIRKRNLVLNDLERMCENTSGTITHLLSDTEALDSKQLERVNCSLLSDLPLPPDVQHCLYHLYNDNRLVYHNFIHLLTLTLYQMYQRLRREELMDLSQCLLQVEGSAEDMKSMCDVFKTFLSSIVNSTKEKQDVSCAEAIKHISEENELPFVKSVLLMPSPLIKINTNCADQKSDTQLLQLTPGENTHKSLFLRYVRHNRNYEPNLRTNLFVSRINFDSSMSLDSNGKQGLDMRSVTPRVKQLCKSITGKYSRLFSSCIQRNIRVNSSMMSLPPTTPANFSAIASTVEKMSSSDLNLNTVAKGLNWNEKSLKVSPVQLTSIKESISQIVPEQQQAEIDCEIKMNKLELNEFTEVQFVNDENKDAVVKDENCSRRRSISDLVERYKKLLETSNSVATKLENKYVEYESS